MLFSWLSATIGFSVFIFNSASRIIVLNIKNLTISHVRLVLGVIYICRNMLPNAYTCQ